MYPSPTCSGWEAFGTEKKGSESIFFKCLTCQISGQFTSTPHHLVYPSMMRQGCCPLGVSYSLFTSALFPKFTVAHSDEKLRLLLWSSKINWASYPALSPWSLGETSGKPPETPKAPVSPDPPFYFNWWGLVCFVPRSIRACSVNIVTEDLARFIGLH